MSEKLLPSNNQVSVIGNAISNPIFSHEVMGEKFYTFLLSVNRISESADEVPVMVSDKIFDISQQIIGQPYEIHGQFRSFNQHTNDHSKLILNVFANEILSAEDLPHGNYIELDGYLCKAPTYRKTPLGREITDFLLGVNRPYGKSDYIPCICWGRNARYAGCIETSGHLHITGRIQSRVYRKRINDTDYEDRTVYEVSVNGLERLDA